MNMKYYILNVVGAVEPELMGPYTTEKERDEMARKIRQEGDESDTILWMNINEASIPDVGAYSNGYMEGIPGFES